MRTSTSACVLAAFIVGASACATSSADGDAVPEIAPEAEVVDVSEPPTEENNPNGLEYGDSLDELDHLGKTEAESLPGAIPGFLPVEWEDLIPPGFSSDEVVDRYEERLTAAEPGSPEINALYDEMNAEFESATVNSELDNEKVQLAGFVAPLTYDGDDITEFLLVPYFGACIHVPPPPANQTVMVTLAEGESLSLEESWGAVWVAGNLTAATTDTDLATAGYSISGPVFGVYNSR